MVLIPRLVGTIVGLAVLPADTFPDSTTPLTTTLISGEIRRREIDGMSLSEPQPCPPPGHPPQSFPGGIYELNFDTGRSILGSNAPTYDNPMQVDSKLNIGHQVRHQNKTTTFTARSRTFWIRVQEMRRRRGCLWDRRSQLEPKMVALNGQEKGGGP